jgi:hypothetical protein
VVENEKKIIMIVLFFLILGGFSIVTFALPDKEFSENENRVLSSMPQWSVENYKDKSFMIGTENYYSDHFLARENWIMTKNGIDIIMGKTEIGGVYFLDNQMVETWKNYDEVQVNRNLLYINDFAKNNSDKNISFLLAPTVQGVLQEDLPGGAGFKNQEDFIVNCYEQLGDTRTISVYDSLYEEKENYIYYRTDHHWTSLGAYIAYEKYCDTLGMQPYELGDFNIKRVSEDFKGTLYSKT